MTRTIPLTRGYVVVVDDSDYEWLTQWKWCVNIKKDGVYGYRSQGSKRRGTRRSVYMHRQILGILDEKGVEGDHINGDTLDNRRGNLRRASRWQNSTNHGMRTDNTSGMPGVDYVKKDKAYRVRIYDHGEEITVGYSKSLDKAKEMRLQAEREKYGEYVRMS